MNRNYNFFRNIFSSPLIERRTYPKSILQLDLSIAPASIGPTHTVAVFQTVNIDMNRMKIEQNVRLRE